MLTANMTRDFVTAARENGVEDCIVKPFAPAQLAGKIAAVVKIKV
jgi:DNA-binding response OmpR family regulator